MYAGAAFQPGMKFEHFPAVSGRKPESGPGAALLTAAGHAHGHNKIILNR